MTWLLIPLFAILDAFVRGNNPEGFWPGSKGAVAAYMAAAVCAAFWWSGVTLPAWQWAVFAGLEFAALWIAYGPGWGAFFTAYSGYVPATKEEEFGSWFADFIEEGPTTPANARRWGTAGMLARHALFIVPFAPIAAFVTPWAWVAAMASPFLGLVYPPIRYLPETEWKIPLLWHFTWTPARLAELVRGALLGFAIVILCNL